VDNLWHAAALGMLDRVEQLLEQRPLAAGEVSQAFWHARSGGQRRAAEYLLAHGAELNWVPDDADGTPLDAASFRGTRQDNLIVRPSADRRSQVALANRFTRVRKGIHDRHQVARHRRRLLPAHRPLPRFRTSGAENQGSATSR
jgi:ankyrin repeat protein